MLKMTSVNNGKMFLTVNGMEIMILVKQSGNGLVWLFDAPEDVRIEREVVRLRRLQGE